MTISNPTQQMNHRPSRVSNFLFFSSFSSRGMILGGHHVAFCCSRQNLLWKKIGTDCELFKPAEVARGEGKTPSCGCRGNELHIPVLSVILRTANYGQWEQ